MTVSIRSSRLAIATLAAATLALSACARVESGPQVTQTREVEPFTAVELRGSAQLDVLVGEAQSVVVAGDEEGLRNLRTQVRNDRLVIDTSDHSFWIRDSEFKVRITVPSLTALAMNGATHASVHGLSGASTSLILSGAGDVEASGTVERLVAQVNGAGGLDLAQLSAIDADVTVNGTGNIKVNASGKLDATVNGVGNIEYSGKPRDVSTAIHGVGNIREAR